MRLPDLAGEEVHLVKMLIPLARPRPGPSVCAPALPCRPGQMEFIQSLMHCPVCHAFNLSGEKLKQSLYFWGGGD